MSSDRFTHRLRMAVAVTVSLVLASLTPAPSSSADDGPGARSSSASATSATESTGAPFLVGGGEFFRASLVWEDGESRYLPFKIQWRAEFSPDGSMIAVADPFCCRDATDIVVYGADGSSRTLVRVPGLVQSMAWSPDGTQIAALSAHNQSLMGEIWRVPLSGAPANQLLAPDEAGFPSPILIQVYGGLSWSPNGSEVAFIGTHPYSVVDFGAAEEDYEQLWVASTTDSSDYRLFHARQTSCDVSCRSYSSPEWSRDGSSIVAYVRETTYGNGPTAAPTSVQAHVALVTRGSASPMRLATIPGIQRNRPLWSSDDTEVAYAYRDNHQREQGRILNLGTGVLREAPTYGYEDWQPCPGGVCVQRVAPKPPPPKVRLRLHVRPGRVVAVGKVVPAHTGRVAVVLERMDRHWLRVQYRRVALNSVSRYRTVFRSIPDRGRCRVVARYGGVSIGAYTIERFHCRRASKE